MNTTRVNNLIFFFLLSIITCSVFAESVDPECAITAGANVEGSSDVNQKLLAAAAEGSVQKILNALEAGGNVNSSDEELGTPLAWAARCGHLAAVKALVSKGADVNEFVAYQKGMQYKFKKSSALIWAASNENVSVVRYLLSRGAVRDRQEEVYEIKDGGVEKFLFKGRSAHNVTKNKKILALLNKN